MAPGAPTLRTLMHDGQLMMPMGKCFKKQKLRLFLEYSNLLIRLVCVCVCVMCQGIGEDTASDLWTIVVWRVFGQSPCSYQACRSGTSLECSLTPLALNLNALAPVNQIRRPFHLYPGTSKEQVQLTLLINLLCCPTSQIQFLHSFHLNHSTWRLV